MARAATMGLLASLASTAGESLTEQARVGLRQGIQFFTETVSVQGTYLWQYSEDLTTREGEGKATPSQGWVQPPGTPAVGLAILEAWRATGDPAFLDSARQTALALAWGQLQSGGWTYFIDFDSQGGRPLAYRHLARPSKRARNVTTLDDNTTQAAVRFLVQVDQALQFQDPQVHECVTHALTQLLAAQYPNGAWPQGFAEPPDASRFPVKPAGYPDSWSRTPTGGDYWFFYTLNDDVLADTLAMLFETAALYEASHSDPALRELGQRCRQAALKGADFILLAQMPEPQPAWAQQYDFDMHPAWARKFEPPAVCGSESQRVLETLIDVYLETGDPKYLAPIPPAIAWLQRSRRPDGRLARFYELRTNRPLYFTRDYQLTYDDRDVPTHYAFAVPDRSSSIQRRLENLRRNPPRQFPARDKSPLKRPPESQIRGILAAQDERGRWVENGRLRYHGPDDPTTSVIRTATFIENVRILSRYLAQSTPQD